MAAGGEQAFHRVEPLVRELGRTVSYAGGNGQGLMLKLAINVSLAAQKLALAQGLLLAERGGIDPKLALDVMVTSSIGPPALQARGPLMLDLPEQAWFDVALMHKDIRLALESGRAAGVPLPSARLADRMLAAATRLGYAHRDVAALFDVLARLDEASGEARRDGYASASAG